VASNLIPTEISTDRLLLRPFQFTDKTDVLAYAQDADWAQFMPVPIPYTEHDVEEFLARSKLLDRNTVADWAITLGGRVIGGIDIGFKWEHRTALIGFSIARDCWSCGYATEAADAVLDSAFNAYDELVRIFSFADKRNIASTRVMEKLGMTLEGCLRSHRFVRGEMVDDVYYGILRQEWQQSRAQE
jgi:ribosomal-protein-alanine N-acetyltransferase